VIYIKQNQDNKFITRFNDKRVLSGGYFLWELKNEFTKDVIYFMLDDETNYPCSYNLFNLTHSSTGSTVGGINTPLDLVAGQYEYKVYETPIQSLSLSAVTGTYIERDILVVEMLRTVNTPNSQINNIYY
jgi:hypothetical protein